ncbi:hypothetical protein MKW94_022577 [Papaver nudicaule]|uniref:Protein ELC-like n=1 Tax=Papaver nudicaule TaxID=74823 RepID=A0AA41VNS2_PAPNU|nr:hypothetical protein [Papaver nudicaule]
MATLTSTRIIDAALRCDGPHSLSYKHHNLKWLIRQHLLSLLNNFPSLKPSIDTFTHDDGTTVKLLVASGYFPVSHNIHLAIWIHESYPFCAPFALLSSASTSKSFHDHPFVSPAGVVSIPYTHLWKYPQSNLLDFARNLVHVFTYRHPFAPEPLGPPRFIDTSLVSKMEALNFLCISLHRDIIASTDKANDDIDALSSLQAELVHRKEILNIELGESRYERFRLKETVRDLAYEADVLMNWLKVNDHRDSHNKMAEDSIDDAFEAVDEESNQVLNCSSEGKAIEDLLFVLDSALKEGVVPLDKYLKQVRTLSREQFFHRAMIVKLRSSDMLYQLDDYETAT